MIEKDEDGYFAFCPELQGCYTQGDSYEEALEIIKDAIRPQLEDRFDTRTVQRTFSPKTTLFDELFVTPTI